MRSFAVAPNRVLSRDGWGKSLRLLSVVVLRPISSSASCLFFTAFDDLRLREAVASIAELVMPVIAVCKLSEFRVERRKSDFSEEEENDTLEGVFMVIAVLVLKQLFRRL